MNQRFILVFKDKLRRIETAKIKCQKRKNRNGPMKRKTNTMKCTKDNIQNKCRHFFVKCDTNWNFCSNNTQFYSTLYQFPYLPTFAFFSYLYIYLLIYWCIIFCFPVIQTVSWVPYFFSYKLIDIAHTPLAIKK